MVSDEYGVTVTRQHAWADSCVEEIVYDVRWRTEPGWFIFDADSPTICMADSEVGGRCEFRAAVDQPGEGGYFGPGALVLAAAGSRVVIYATELREARICCFPMRLAGTTHLSQDRIATFDLLTSRYMFRNERIRTCAALLDRDGGRPGQGTYTRFLAAALLAATVGLIEASREQSQDQSLNGAQWGAICEYIRDNVQRSIVLDAVASVVQMPSERLGLAFRKATGMSLRQWQVDCRVRRAQRLLLDNPRESLATVAALSGFTDQSHFSRAFLKTMGVTPTAWLHRWK